MTIRSTLRSPADPESAPELTFDAFYAGQTPHLLMVAARRCGAETAKDIVQEVMLRLYQHWELWAHVDEQTTKKYAFAAVRNEAISWWRKSSTRREVTGTDLGVSGWRPADLSDPVEAHIVGRHLNAGVVAFILNRLTLREAEVLIMTASGLSHGEIAAQLPIEETTSRSTLSTARLKFARYLQEEGWL